MGTPERRHGGPHERAKDAHSPRQVRPGGAGGGRRVPVAARVLAVMVAAITLLPDAATEEQMTTSTEIPVTKPLKSQ
jgi:hypothetical protein